MANRIKGITVEIGGDTTKLDKALAGTNKEISNTQKQLRDVERLLKLDPGNTELLAQRQKLLAQSVETTSAKLNTLRKAADSAGEALARGNAYQKAYEPLKTELDAVNASVKALEANAGSMQAKLDAGEISTAQYDAFSKKLDSTRKRADELQQAIEAVNEEFSGAKMDQAQYDALQRELIETEKQLKKVENAAKNSSVAMGKFEAAADKVSSVSGKVGDALSPVSKAAAAVGAAALATVPATDELRTDLSKLDTNAQRAGVGIDTARQAFKSFNAVTGETDSSIEAVSNLLQAGFTESNLQKAVEGLANAAISFPDTIKIESLADSLQESIATGEATGQYAEMLDRLGVGAEQFAAGLAQCTSAAQEQQYALSFLTEGPLKGAYEGWAQTNQELVENRNASLELQMALGDLAEELLPIMTSVTEISAGFVNWFTGLDDGAQTAILSIVGISAAISPLAGLVSSTSAALPQLIALFSTLGVKGTIVAVAITAIVGVVAALAGAWDQMSGAEKVVAVLGVVTAAAITAAVALGAFQSALTLGIAAAAIVAGVAAIMLAINSATSKAEQAAQQAQMSIPGLANGGVVPPNNPFLAVLGDNRQEPEIVAPYSTIKQATSEAIAERGGSAPVEIVVRAADGFTRNLSYSLSEESARRGVSLVKKG